MSRLPTVAIIGRPNTGKSTLFNRLVGRRKAIVSAVAGTTRDHVAHRVDGDRVDYLLIDTGGMGGGTEDLELEDDVHRQSLLALETADVIVLTLNSQEEMTSSDMQIVDILRKQKRSHVPVVLAVTKCDDLEQMESLTVQYLELGLSDSIVPLSAVHKHGVSDLEDAIEIELEKLNFQKVEESDTDSIPGIAIIGKPNVGKSSLVNAFMSESQRKQSPLLVSDIPGTTRDATDTIVTYHDKKYCFVDTAGIKRQKQTEGAIETYSYFRSVQSLQHADICVLVLDANQPVSRQDKRIAGLAVEEGKGLIILLNKVDSVSTEEKQNALREIQLELQFCSFAPVLPCSAQTRDGLLKIFDMIETVQRNRIRRVPTKELHNWYKDAVYGQPMSSLASSKFITQAEELPPTFILFVKDPKKVQVSQLRYLDNQLRKTFAFEGTPVRWITKKN